MAVAAPSRKVWQSLLSSAGLPSECSAQYSAIFANERLRLSHVLDLTRAEFEDLGVTALGDQITIKKHIKKLLEDKSDMEDSDSDAERKYKREPIREKINKEAARKGKLSTRRDGAKKKYHSESDDGRSPDVDSDAMDVDVRKQGNEHSSAVHRLRVVRGDGTRQIGALRMLSIANSGAQPKSRDDANAEQHSKGKLRSDSLLSSDSRNKNDPPREPANNLSRLTTPAQQQQPILEPVLIRDIKLSKAQSSALKRLGPKKTGISALTRLGDIDNRKISQAGPILTRTIQGLGANNPKSFRKQNNNVSLQQPKPRNSALQRLDKRGVKATSNSNSHPLARY